MLYSGRPTLSNVPDTLNHFISLKAAILTIPVSEVHPSVQNVGHVHAMKIANNQEGKFYGGSLD